MYIILIDSGTTNSRIRIVDERNEVIDTLKIGLGVRNTAIDGSNNKLKPKISKAILDIIEKNSLHVNQINYIVASGMITSNLGIYEVPHVTAPASIADIVSHSVTVEYEEFYNIPCIFVPGVKNKDSFDYSDLHSINKLDVMRGEEVESFGLLKQIKPKGNGLMVLPGSHTKYVMVSNDQTLVSIRSTLGGEVIQAVKSQTILSDSLNEKLLEKVEQTTLLDGYKIAEKVGLTRSLYHIRLLHLFSSLSENERTNYYVGAILQSDIKALTDYIKDIGTIDWIIVGGSSPLRSAFVHLLNYVKLSPNIIEASDKQVEYAPVFGAHEVALQYISINR